MTTTDQSRSEWLPGTTPTASPANGPSDQEEHDRLPVATHRFRTLAFAAAGYLVCSIILWWNVWSNHPTSTTTCGCGDSSLFTWFLAWPAYAISHGLNPLYSTAMFHPGGVNLLSNTGEAGIGIVLSPVTWLFGPIATLNVAVTLAPALSSFGMFVLLRRWVAWAPAAFIGGLLYGFSPFIVNALTDAHLMLGMAVIPPLVVACLDEMLARQRRHPLVSGAVLGLLLTAQFFIGTESLVMMGIAAGFGLLIVLLYGILHPQSLRRRAPHAVAALVAGGVTSAVLLAYPVWFALAGPAHLSGPIWPDSFNSYGGTNLKDLVVPAPASASMTAMAHELGGYQGPTLSGQYFGLGLMAVLVFGLVVWRRDVRLWLFAVVGAALVPLSMGLSFQGWTLWQLFARLPLIENVIPSRFLILTFLAAACMLGLIIDHTHGAINRRRLLVLDAPDGRPVRYRWLRDAPEAGSVVAIVLAAVALLPIGAYLASGIPLTSQPVVVPRWFRTVAPHLQGDQVLLEFPVPFGLLQSAMTWQAVDGMHYSMVGGGGPGGIPGRAGKERPGFTYLDSLSLYGDARGPVTPQEITAVRQALDGWGVTMVVLPNPSQLPVYQQARSVRSVAVLMTAATGQGPVRQADAWVWTGLQHAGPPIVLSSAGIARCAAGTPGDLWVGVAAATGCVLAR